MISNHRILDLKRCRRFTFLVSLAVASGGLVGAKAASAETHLDVLHSFGPAVNLTASLIQATDGNFYGTTPQGSTSGYIGYGTVFKMTPSGTVTVLHAFTGAPTDGANPYAALIQATDGNFYGTTAYGGSSRFGTVFQMTPGGTVTVLHSFTGGTTDGANPYAALIQATDGNFYGTTANSGSSSAGTVFKMTPSGTVTLLHSFFGGTADGADPYAALIQGTDGNFYGTTAYGGGFLGGAGTVFQMTPSGTVTVLHAFSSGTDGSFPKVALIQATDGNFYGTTAAGGATGLGTVFKMTPTGTLTVLHTFAGGTDGANSFASLIQATDGNFYGTTAGGGAAGLGTVFKMTSSGSVTVLHAFNGGTTDGAYPTASLIQGTDGNFYGTTSASDASTVFKMTPGGTVTILHALTGGTTDGSYPDSAPIQATDGSFYGTTVAGGASGLGTVFKMTPSGNVTVSHAFTGAPTDGASPNALIQASDGNFYGTTGQGGASGLGTVFKMTPSGNVTVLHAFTGAPTDGASPIEAALIQASDGNFYGITFFGGGTGCQGGCGTVFKMSPNGTVTVLHAFTGGTTDGASPSAALIQGIDGNFYGTTQSGGTSGGGTVFKMTPSGALTVLHAFSGGTDGSNPFAALIQATDGNFYGTTAGGGAAGLGTVFMMTPSGTVTVLHAFSGGTDGSNPFAALIQATDGNFYGTTPVGGVSGLGTVFMMTPSGTVTVLHAFTGTDGASPYSALIEATDGNLYGTASHGGIYGTGIVFRLSPPVPDALMSLDQPASGSTLGASFVVGGWAIDRGAGAGTGVDAVHVWAYPNPGSGAAPVFLGVSTYGIARPDIGALFGSQFTNSGFQLAVSSLTAGRYQITAFEHSAVTNEFAVSASATVTVTGPVSNPAMVLDSPSVNSTVGRTVTFAGWAIDRGALSGTGTDQVVVWAYPSGGGAPQYVGAATYGTARPDIGGLFGSQFTNSGFQMTATITPGVYTFVAFAHSTVASAYSGVAAPNVTVQAAANTAFLAIDTPGPNTTATRPFTLSGWAVDTAASTGTGIDAIALWGYPTSGAAPFFVGFGTYGASRPDIGALFGNARFAPSGFSLTVTASELAAAGTYYLVVFGHSTVTNGYTAVSFVPVTVR